jgi:osmotically inducible lipoprotein OsmB
MPEKAFPHLSSSAVDAHPNEEKKMSESKFRVAVPAAFALLLAACGSTTEDRVGGGAAAGAGTGAAIGALFGGVGAIPGALIGAGVGGGTGAVTSDEQVDLGEPVWKRW